MKPQFILVLYIYEYTFCLYLKGLIPNPEEERDLQALNRPLLDAVPESLDFDVFDPDQTIRE